MSMESLDFRVGGKEWRGKSKNMEDDMGLR